MNRNLNSLPRTRITNSRYVNNLPQVDKEKADKENFNPNIKPVYTMQNPKSLKIKAKNPTPSKVKAKPKSKPKPKPKQVMKNVNVVEPYESDRNNKISKFVVQ